MALVADVNLGKKISQILVTRLKSRKTWGRQHSQWFQGHFVGATV